PPCVYRKCAPLVAIRRTDARRRDLVEWHVAGNAVMRIDIPHTIFHAQDLALIVGGAILEPPRVVTIKPALIIGRETPLPLAIAATPSVVTIVSAPIGAALMTSLA